MGNPSCGTAASPTHPVSAAFQHHTFATRCFLFSATCEKRVLRCTIHLTPGGSPHSERAFEKLGFARLSRWNLANLMKATSPMPSGNIWSRSSPPPSLAAGLPSTPDARSLMASVTPSAAAAPGNCSPTTCRLGVPSTITSGYGVGRVYGKSGGVQFLSGEESWRVRRSRRHYNE